MKKFLFPLALACLIAPWAGAQNRAPRERTPAQTFGERATLRKLERSGKNWRTTARYPVFRADMPLTRYASWQSRLEAQRQSQEQIAQFKEYLAGDITPEAPYEFEFAPRLVFYGPNLISLQQNIYYFTGGAHPNSVTTTRNYGLNQGRPKRLTLGDFFRPGSNYRAATMAKVMDKLKTQGADWVVDGTVKDLNTEQLNNFTVDSSGLTWIFSPYEMGPYAAGYIEARLNIGELGPNFRRELLKEQ